MNSTVARRTKSILFELLTRIKMKNMEEIKLNVLLKEGLAKSIVQEKESLTEDAKIHIMKIQVKNKHNYDQNRKKPTLILSISEISSYKDTIRNPHEITTQVLYSI